MMRRLLLAGGLVVAAVSCLPGRAFAYGGSPTGGITTATQDSVIAQYKFDDGTTSGGIRMYFAFVQGRNDKSAVPQAPTPPTVVCPAGVTQCGSANMGDNWPLKYNGQYTVSSTADCKATLGCQSSATDTKSFSVALPPAAPSGLKAAFDDKTKAVSLSWTANTEPDLSGYEVQRKAPGESGYKTVGLSTKPSFIDEKATSAGAYSYQVVAHRYLDSTKPADQAGDIGSPFSAATSATVPVSATPTTVGADSSANSSPSANPASSSSSSSNSAAQAGKVDLKSFAAMLDKARSSGKHQVVVEGPDAGFKETLPFKADAKEDGPDSSQVINQSMPGIHAKSSQRPALLFVAGSLLATVVLMHLLWLKSEVNRSTPLDPDPTFGG